MPAYRIDFKKSLSLTSMVVTADTPAQAIRFVAGSIITCTTLTGEAVAHAVSDGLKVHDARQTQKELDLPPATGDIAGEIPASLPMFMHKRGCSADPWTPISGKGCRCTQIDILPEDPSGQA